MCARTRSVPRPRSRSAAFALHAPAGSSPLPERLTRAAIPALAAALAVALLAMTFGPHVVGDYFTETDFYGGYAEGARAIQRGHLDPSRYGVVGPGYEIALALVGFVVRDLFLAAGLIAALSSVTTLALLADLLRRRAGGAAALLAALFLATNAYFFRYGWAVTTDAFAIALQMLALWLLLARGGPRAVALAGVVTALAFLTRYSAGALLPAGLIAIALGDAQASRRGRAMLLFVAGFALPVVPWVAFSLAHGGTLGMQLHHNVAYEVFARPRGVVWDDYQRHMQAEFPTPWSVIARDPAAVAGRLAFNVVDHVRLDAMQLLGWPLAVAAALGLVLGWRDGALARVRGVLIAGAALALSLVPAFHSERYALALLPAYTTLAALAFASPRFACVWRGAWLKPALALVPAAVALAALVRVQARTLDQLPREVLEVARALRAEARPGDHVIARKPHLAWHAGVQPAAFPFADSLATLARYAHAHGMRWLYFSWPEAELRPALAFLLDTSAVVPGLTVRHTTAPRPAVLYEIGADFGRDPAWLANPEARAWHLARARLQVDGNDVTALGTVGVIERRRGRPEVAVAVLTHAARLAPGDIRVWLALGDAALAARQNPLGEQAYARAEALDPASTEARVGRGWAALAAGNAPLAAQRWRPVVDAAADPATLQRMVEVYRGLGDPATAARAEARLRTLGAAP
jgi:hypothetical protein